MQIISHFHDYYDTAMALGHDDHVFFKRVPLEIATGRGINDPMVREHKWMRPNLQLNHQPIKLKNGGELTVEEVSIFFCGKLYAGVRLTHRKTMYALPKRDTFYSEDTLTKFLKPLGLELDAIFRKVHVRTKAFTVRWLARGEPRLDLGETTSAELLQRAIDGKTVMIAYINHGYYFQHHTIIENPRLSDFDFYRVKDAYQAFQEIDMFLSGVLAPENKPMTVIDDRYKRDAHGFDEWSFKKLPTKKR